MRENFIQVENLQFFVLVIMLNLGSFVRLSRILVSKEKNFLNFRDDEKVTHNVAASYSSMEN